MIYALVLASAQSPAPIKHGGPTSLFLRSAGQILNSHCLANRWSLSKDTPILHLETLGRTAVNANAPSGPCRRYLAGCPALASRPHIGKRKVATVTRGFVLQGRFVP